MLRFWKMTSEKLKIGELFLTLTTSNFLGWFVNKFDSKSSYFLKGFITKKKKGAFPPTAQNRIKSYYLNPNSTLILFKYIEKIKWVPFLCSHILFMVVTLRNFSHTVIICIQCNTTYTVAQFQTTSEIKLSRFWYVDQSLSLCSFLQTRSNLKWLVNSAVAVFVKLGYLWLYWWQFGF